MAQYSKRKIIASDGHMLSDQLRLLGFSRHNVFFKHVKGLGYYSDSLDSDRIRSKECSDQQIKIEYEMLCRIHEILPKNSATPISLVNYDNEQVVGYLTNYIEGRELGGVLESLFVSGRNAVRFKLENEFIDLAKVLKRNNTGHGDLGYTNAIITEDGTIHLIDPFAVKTTSNLKDAIREARRRDDIWIEAFNEHYRQ